MVIAEHVPVVRRVKDQGFLEPAAFIERLQNSSDFFVDMTHGAVVSRARLMNLGRSKIPVPDVQLRPAQRPISFSPFSGYGFR